MITLIEENSTRREIILHLKKAGSMSIDDLSKVVDITPMGIRQHLLSLEKRGIVRYTVQKRGIGRPGFLYMLTEKADDLFPKSYDKLALTILRDIKKHHGDKEIDEIFGWRRASIFKAKHDRLTGCADMEELLDRMKKQLEDDGYLVELSRNNGHFHLKQYNCPIHKIASEFRDACEHELRMYQELFGEGVTREHAISEGAHSCHYIIPNTSQQSQ